MCVSKWQCVRGAISAVHSMYSMESEMRSRASRTFLGDEILSLDGHVAEKIGISLFGYIALHNKAK